MRKLEIEVKGFTKVLDKRTDKGVGYVVLFPYRKIASKALEKGVFQDLSMN